MTGFRHGFCRYRFRIGYTVANHIIAGGAFAICHIMLHFRFVQNLITSSAHAPMVVIIYAPYIGRRVSQCANCHTHGIGYLVFCFGISETIVTTAAGIIFNISLFQTSGRSLWNFCQFVGQDYYNAITRRYYKGADAALIVFSVTDKDSFTNVRSWYDKVVNECDHIPMILVMSKIDLLNEGVVKEEDAVALSRQLGLELIKVSSKDGVMVNEAFEKLAIKHFKGGNVSNGPDNIENVTKGIADKNAIGNNGEDVKEFGNKEVEAQKSVRSNKEEQTGFKLVGEIQGEKKKKKKCCKR